MTRGIADTRSDIYAVGIMMYEMLVGDQPFKGDQPVQIAYQHANESVPAPSTKNPAIPVALDELVLWATARDPEQRPRDARAMLDQLFETQNLIRDGLGGVSTATQRTMVMPAATPATTVHESGETQVMSRARRTGPVAVESAHRLSTTVQKRHRRGFWLFGLFLVFAAAVTGTGWYFGSGPGAAVGIPSVAGKSVADATAMLNEAGFTVGGQDEVFDWKTDPGLVSSTDPEAGARVTRDKPVLLHVSKGAQPLAVPALGGKTLDEAKKIITDAGFVVGDDLPAEFSADVPVGVVLHAVGADGVEFAEGAQYPEHQPIRLSVSAGPFPDVFNIPVADATQALGSVGIQVERGDAAFDNTGQVPADNVLSIDPVTTADGTPRPFVVGDTVTIHLSKGADLVTVPNVIGTEWTTAKQQLLDAGLDPTYNATLAAIPGAVVKSTDPAEGAQLLRGSKIAVTITATL
ncbi:hypothetical protein GCM10025866_32790 [Naasia aerilata]|uniref:Serine/threonine-protein kinase n=1 Tax=Naasia aerilata TaxID=1162966 RepID=A0ABM8GGA4_9MICO|nr:Stk1 family PASTA domain-containing Ser/Thr kinase [Naasia aerilata]BDZ47370.1 hypothetical protein GCM10025866_32790 [Naasia aerilata]